MKTCFKDLSQSKKDSQKQRRATLISPDFCVYISAPKSCKFCTIKDWFFSSESSAASSVSYSLESETASCGLWLRFSSGAERNIFFPVLQRFWDCYEYKTFNLLQIVGRISFII